MAALQLKNWKDWLLIVDEDQIGPKQRLNRIPPAPHPMIREDWGTIDSMRGVLGSYYTVYNSSLGPKLWNAGSPNARRSKAWDRRPSRLKRMNKQIKKPVLTYEYVDDGTKESIVISRKSGNWNSYSNKSAAAKNFLSGDGWRNRFFNFILGEYTFTGIDATFDGALTYIVDVPFSDHTSEFWLPSSDPKLRLEAGMDLYVEPVYNYYDASVPVYEITIGSPHIQEYHLPNVYYLQSELQNTSSTLLATYHLPALTLNQTVEWFTVSNAQTATETNVGEYYQLYSEKLSKLTFNTRQYRAINESLYENNRNFAVLHSDLKVLQEQHIETLTMPFYTKLVMGYDSHSRTGHKSEVSLLRRLATYADTKNFIDILQFYTIQKISEGVTDGLACQSTFRKRTGRNEAKRRFLTGRRDYPVLYDLEQVIEDMLDSTSPTSASRLAAAINRFTATPRLPAEATPFRLLRDYARDEEEMIVNPRHVKNAKYDLFEDPGGAVDVGQVIKTFEQVLQGVKCHTETLMYIVSKRPVVNGLLQPPVQTYYISEQFPQILPLTLFDSQVKYNQKYVYEIDRVMLVFGNEYEYDGMHEAPPVVQRGRRGDLGLEDPEPPTRRSSMQSRSGAITTIGAPGRRTTQPDRVLTMGGTKQRPGTGGTSGYGAALQRPGAGGTKGFGAALQRPGRRGGMSTLLRAGTRNSPSLATDSWKPSPRGGSKSSRSGRGTSKPAATGGSSRGSASLGGSSRRGRSGGSSRGSASLGGSSRRGRSGGSSRGPASLGGSLRGSSKGSRGGTPAMERPPAGNRRGGTPAMERPPAGNRRGGTPVSKPGRARDPQTGGFPAMERPPAGNNRGSNAASVGRSTAPAGLAGPPAPNRPTGLPGMPALEKPGPSTPAGPISNQAVVPVTNCGSIKAMIVPYVVGGMAATIIDKPPVPPEISFYASRGVDNKIRILLNSSTGELNAKPVAILDEDKVYIEEEYLAQTGEALSFEEIMTSSDAEKLRFKSDDPVDLYELFRLDTPPASYGDFLGGTMITVNPVYGIPGEHIDTIKPNKKYYYCVRAIDMHNNKSNPTHIYEIEMVNNNGQIFLRQEIFDFPSAEQVFHKSGRRFLYVEPAMRQLIYDSETATPGPAALDIAPPTNTLLGAPEIDRVWGKKFRLRVTSKKTGRKTDLNITFRNSGLVKPSE